MDDNFFMKKKFFLVLLVLIQHSSGAGILGALGSFIAGGIGGFLGGRVGSKKPRPIVYNTWESQPAVSHNVTINMAGVSNDIRNMHTDFSARLSGISSSLNHIISQNKENQEMIAKTLNTVEEVDKKIDLLAEEMEANSRRQDIRDLAAEMISSINNGPDSFNVFLNAKFSQLENTKDLYDFKRLEENLLIVGSQMFQSVLSDSSKPDILRSQNAAFKYAQKLQDGLSQINNHNASNFLHKKNLSQLKLSMSNAKVHLYTKRIQTIDDTISDSLASLDPSQLKQEQEKSAKNIEGMIRSKRSPMNESSFRVLMVNYLEGGEEEKFSLSFEILEKLKGDYSSQAEEVRRLIMINLALAKNNYKIQLENEKEQIKHNQEYLEKAIFCEQEGKDINKRFGPRLLNLYGKLALEKLGYAFLKAGNKNTSEIEGFIARSIAKMDDVDDVKALEKQLKTAFREENGSNQILYSAVHSIIDRQVKDEVNEKYRLNQNDAKAIALMAMIEQDSPANTVYGFVNLVQIAQNSRIPMKDVQGLETAIDNTLAGVQQVQEEMLSAFESANCPFAETELEAASLANCLPSDSLCAEKNINFLSLQSFMKDASNIIEETEPNSKASLVPDVNSSALLISKEEQERLQREKEREQKRLQREREREQERLERERIENLYSCYLSCYSLGMSHSHRNAVRREVTGRSVAYIVEKTVARCREQNFRTSDPRGRIKYTGFPCNLNHPRQRPMQNEQSFCMAHYYLSDNYSVELLTSHGATHSDAFQKLDQKRRRMGGGEFIRGVRPSQVCYSN